MLLCVYCMYVYCMYCISTHQSNHSIKDTLDPNLYDLIAEVSSIQSSPNTLHYSTELLWEGSTVLYILHT